jgi:hypothetical protein
MPHKFWIAWSNHGITGSRRTQYEYASNDANDLARKYPGKKFYVLEAKDWRMVELPPVITTKL